MKNKSDNANKNWVYVRPMGNPAVKDACLHTPNMFFSYKAGAYMIPKNEKEVNEEVKKNHVPLAFIRGTKELNEALHMTPGIRFSMSTKLWSLPLTDLAKAHPMLKQASVYDSLSNVFTKGGTQISAALRETIGTQYDEKLGQEMLTAYKEKKSQQNTNTEKRVYEQKKTQTNTQTQKQVQTKHYYRKGR